MQLALETLLNFSDFTPENQLFHVLQSRLILSKTKQCKTKQNNCNTNKTNKKEVITLQMTLYKHKAET